MLQQLPVPPLPSQLQNLHVLLQKEQTVQHFLVPLPPESPADNMIYWRRMTRGDAIKLDNERDEPGCVPTKPFVDEDDI